MVWGTRVKPLPMRNWTSGLERLLDSEARLRCGSVAGLIGGLHGW